MRLVLLLACSGLFCSVACADIPGNRPNPPRFNPPNPAPAAGAKSIEANVTVRNERLPGHVRAKLLLPKDLLAAVDQAPANETQFAGGKVRTVIAGLMLSIAAASLVWVGRGRRVTKTVVGSLLALGLVAGAWSLATANPPPPMPPIRSGEQPPDKIVIEYTNAIGAPVVLILNSNPNR